MKTAAAYVRVSTHEQAEYSPHSQMKMIEEYALHNGYLLPKACCYIDEGISGRHVDRPAFQQMMAAAKQNPRPFDVILLWKYSRFARSREDSVVYKSMLRRQCGIEVLSVSEPIGNDNTSVLIEAVIEAMDEYYSLNLAEEVRRGMHEKKCLGEPVSAPALGYRIQDKRFVPDPERMGVVQWIFSAYLSGKSERKIAASLNQMEVHTMRGNPFETRAIHYILCNPVYAGLINTKPAHEALIDAQSFENVQKKLQSNLKSHQKYARADPDSVLQGLVRCSNCGHTLVRTRSSMQCHAYAKGMCHVSHSITEQYLLCRVLQCIERDLDGICTTLHVRKMPSPADDTFLHTQLEQANRKLSRVYFAYENGTDTLEEYTIHKQRLLEAIRFLEAQLLQKKPSMQKTVFSETAVTLPQLLHHPAMTSKDQNMLLRLFISKIVFNRTQNSLNVYYYI